jgi:GNAT superfamily N-acetyltransferase
MTNGTEDVRFRRMRRAELDRAVDWAEAEGWNPGLADADAFWAADPEGFWVAERRDELLACISVVRHGPSFGFLGFYICRPDQRGRGIGFALWRHALPHLEERCVGLDGVVAQQANYRRSGFVLAHRSIRFGAERPAPPAMPPEIEVVPAAAQPFPDLLDFDHACFGAPREAFLRAWLTLPGHVPLVARGPDGALLGLAVLRPCRKGSKIGPLFAVTPAAATALFGAACRAATGAVFVDVPETNAAATAMAHDAGMEQVFETARMYRGTPPRHEAACVFGVTSLELG